MEFRGRGRKKTGMSLYMALGLCIAAACLVALSVMINRQNDAAKKNNELTEWASEQTAEQSAENIYEPGEAFSDQMFTAEDTTDGNMTELSGSEQQESDIMPYRQLPEETTDDMSGDVITVGKTDEADGDDAVYADARVIMDTSDAVIEAPAKLTLPVNGKIIKPYSGTELVFCSTFGDWRVHQGMDIAADPGGEVHAAAAGSVIDFVEDPLYGYTAVVDQGGDIMLYYCGLSSTCMVSPGMKISAGDVIGYVGEVPCETSDGSHIHLAMMKNGEFADPSKYIAP